MSQRAAVAILAFWITSNVTLGGYFLLMFLPHLEEAVKEWAVFMALVGTIAGLAALVFRLSAGLLP